MCTFSIINNHYLEEIVIPEFISEDEQYPLIKYYFPHILKEYLNEYFIRN